MLHFLHFTIQPDSWSPDVSEMLTRISNISFVEFVKSGAPCNEHHGCAQAGKHIWKPRPEDSQRPQAGAEHVATSFLGFEHLLL